MKKAELTSEWVTTAEICRQLGVSNDYLYRLKSYLTPGEHYRNIGFSKYRACYRWHLKRIEKLINQQT